ncbi:MAG: acyltransferase [Chloroflexi bacterium]|nr:acyltransferase [Chloroflexota bacterium]
MTRTQSICFTQHVWLEPLRVLAIGWIFLNHVAEQLFGFPLIANPSAEWPPLHERIVQLQPMTGMGLWDVPFNLLRYIGWLGDAGVQLFLIVSGFGLSWSLLSRQHSERLDVQGFYRRRLSRIYPLWIGAHLLFIATWLLLGLGLSPFSKSTYLSLIGFRATPSLMYYFNPSWWYIGLIIQLYLVFPLLWAALQRLGPVRLLVIVGGTALIVRLAGLLVLSDYLDAWQRGAIFITRLPEFLFGMSLAAAFANDREHTASLLRTAPVRIAALIAVLGAIPLSLSLVGMALAPAVSGIGLFVLFYNLLAQPLPGTTVWRWLSDRSFAFFLVHQPIVMTVVHPAVTNPAMTMVHILLVAGYSLGVAVFLEFAVSRALRSPILQLKRWSYRRVGLLATTTLIALYASLVCGELLVRRFDPQEALGWGERLALEPSEPFGWRLRPEQTTRLRWESYDYVVQSNSLGFPGPEYAPPKNPAALRVLVTGDAFTSAEGVDTDQAWPRLLERRLSDLSDGRSVEVLNFAMTGYGPNQYATVVETYAPIYKPDVIIVEMFVNDYEDVLISNEVFHASIGFNHPHQHSLAAVLRLSQLQTWIKLRIHEPLAELVTGRPRPHGSFLGQFSALEHTGPVADPGAQAIVKERLMAMAGVADQIGARLMIVLVPAPVQACSRDDLLYFPRPLDLSDPRFDTTLPQRTTLNLANTSGVGYFDLLPALHREAGACLYQPRNLHLLITGHAVVANAVADALIDGGYLKESGP